MYLNAGQNWHCLGISCSYQCKSTHVIHCFMRQKKKTSNYNIKDWGTNLESCKPGSLWAELHSWWVGGCASTGIPSLSHTTSRTSDVTHFQSPAGTDPVGLCLSIHRESHKPWQSQPKSAPKELHPKGRPWLTWKKKKPRQTQERLKAREIKLSFRFIKMKPNLKINVILNRKKLAYIIYLLKITLTLWRRKCWEVEQLHPLPVS